MENQEQEKIMYTEHGGSVRVIHELEGGFVAAPLYEDDQHYEGDPEFYPRLFKNPPTERQHETIRSLENQIEELRKKRGELREEVKQAEHAMEQACIRIDTLKKHKGLELLEDFMTGNITHYVQHGYDDVKIKPFVRGKDEANKDNEFFKDDFENFKLVTLFGRSNGDLQWKISQYKDGSGSSYDVYLCRSEEEAHQKALEVVQELVNRPQGINEYILKIANAYKVEIPSDKLEDYQENRRRSLRENIEQYKGSIDKWEQELNTFLTSPRAQ